MATSYDVRMRKTKVYKGKKNTYYVRWTVAKAEFTESCSTTGLADSFRSKLVAAMREGIAFDVETGLPVTMIRESNTMFWLDFARAYVDMKWPDVAPGTRRTIVDALVPITSAIVRRTPDRPDREALNKALRQTLNPTRRDADRGQDEVQAALRWLSRGTEPVSDLGKADVLRQVVSDVEKRADGKRAAADTIRLRRTTLSNALDFAVEKKLLPENPLTDVKVPKRKATLRQVDRRSVANPFQARMLLAAVGKAGRPGPPLVAFFGLMYYAALRPEEAANIKKHNLSLPEKGWGEIHLEKAAPEIGGEWTDSGTRSEEGPLKHRDADVGRTVPCCPELTELLHSHLNRFGTSRDDRLFRGARDGGRIGSTTYGRVWAKAREVVFTPEVIASPLAKRPYDLRHAGVSTWLNATGDAPRVAEWAGHSLAVLLRVYAKCIDGGEQAALAKVEQALRG